MRRLAGEKIECDNWQFSFFCVHKLTMMKCFVHQQPSQSIGLLPMLLLDADVEVSHETFSPDLSKFPSIIVSLLIFFLRFGFHDETFFGLLILLQFKFSSLNPNGNEIFKRSHKSIIKKMENLHGSANIIPEI